MSLAELNSIKETIKVRLNERRAGMMGIRKLRRENTQSAKDLKTRIGALGEILGSEIFEGRLELGVNPKEIDWIQMPEPVKNIFKPEFSYQPEDITDFGITTGRDGCLGSADLRISLYRREMPWIYIVANAIVRPKYASSSVSVICQHSPSQIKEGREAIQVLEKSLFVDNDEIERLVRSEDGEEAGQLIRSLKSLELGGEILNFVAGQVRKRINSSA